jgi:protein tyrosine phosphatase
MKGKNKNKKLENSNKSNTPEQTSSILTVKVSSGNPINLSKFLANIQSQFEPYNTSRVFYSATDKKYFAYLNFLDSEIADKLQEISAFPPGV